MPEDADGRSSTLRGSAEGSPQDSQEPPESSGGAGLSLPGLLKGFFAGRNGEDNSRSRLDEIIVEEAQNGHQFTEQERNLLLNILGLRETVVEDIMVPRADIFASDGMVSIEDITLAMAQNGHSRLPIYRDSLDTVLGMVHIKDLVSAPDKTRPVGTLRRECLFVAPSARVLDLLLEMRQKRIHMALVVDEYGGVDGLVTIEDLVEQIVGEIEDEHDTDSDPEFERREDGTVLADARVPVEEFEEAMGFRFDEEDREEVDTLGGLVFLLAGRVPSRGEIIHDPSGFDFEVVDADPRRIRTLIVRPVAADGETSGTGRQKADKKADRKAEKEEPRS
ncbi:MAG: hemolysin family protein [Rhodospirillaceae bacterium]